MNDDDPKLQQLKDIVSKIIPADQADSFVQYARIDAFTNDDGGIDQDKVMGHLTAIAVARAPQLATPQQPRQWGQGSAPGGPPHVPGDHARAALKRRHGVGPGAPHTRIDFGARGRAAAQERHRTEGV